MEELLPTDKLKKRIAECADSKKRLVVLVATGAYCPVHNMHLKVFELAKEHLEKQDMIVVAGQ